MRMMIFGLFLAGSPLMSSAFSPTPSLAPGRHSATRPTRHHSDTLGHTLRFRSGDEDDAKYKSPIKIAAQKTNNNNEDNSSQWWKSILPTYVTSPTTPQDETSQRVDEYLKFLDKRYHQIHDEEENQKKTAEQQQQTPKRQQSQFMRWLGKENFEYSQSDALYALGLAAKAGRRHAGSKKVTAGSETAPSNPAAEVVDTTGETTRSFQNAVVRAKQSRAFQSVANARHALLRFEAVKLKQFAAALLRLVKRAPAFPAWLLRVGGGKRPIAVAVGVLSVVLFHVLLPAVSAFVRESLASQA